MSKSLPTLVAEAAELSTALIESGGEITPEIENQLVMSGQDLKDKLDAYGYVIDSLKSRGDYALERMRQWEQIATQCERARENVKNRIKNAMDNMNLDDVHGFEYAFRIMINPPSVIIENENIIPQEYITTEVKTVIKISKREILDAIRDGRDVPGARVERGTRLVTKTSNRKELDVKPIVEKV